MTYPIRPDAPSPGNVAITDPNNPAHQMAVNADGSINVNGGGSGGGGGAVTIADGANVTQGATTDSANANTVVGQLKQIQTNTASGATQTTLSAVKTDLDTLAGIVSSNKAATKAATGDIVDLATLLTLAGTPADANTVASLMGRFTKIRDLLAATLTVQGTITEANSASIKTDLDTVVTNTTLLATHADAGTINTTLGTLATQTTLAAAKVDLDSILTHDTTIDTSTAAINTTTGTGTDANTVNSIMGRLTKIRDLLNATLTVGGTVTANAGTNLNTSLLALEAGGNLATLVTNTADLLADGDNLATINTNTATTATQTTTAATNTGNTATNTSNINTAIGAQADAAWSGSGSGSLIAVLKKVEALLAATLTITGTITANAGSGNFTVVQPTGSNLHVVVDSSVLADTIATGNLTAAQPTVGTPVAGGTVSITLGDGQATFEAQLTGTFSVGTTIQFEGTDDAGTTTNWIAVVGYNTAIVNPLPITSVGGPGPYIIRGSAAGYQQIRMRASALTIADNVAVRLVGTTAALGIGGLLTNDGSFAKETGGNLATLVTNTADLLADGDHLATIDTNTANIPAKGQATKANSVPVTMASDQGALGSAVIQAVAGTALAADQSNTELRSSTYVTKTTAGDTALTLGQATMVNSLPVTMASNQGSIGSVAQGAGAAAGTSWRVAGDFTEQAGLSAGALNADLVASTDVSSYKWVSLHVNANAYSGTLTFQASNDNSNWSSIYLQLSNSSSYLTITTATNVLLFGPVNYRFFRVRMTSYTSGTAQGTLELYTSPSVTNFIGIGSNGSSVSQSGTWTIQPGNTQNTTPWLVTPGAPTGASVDQSATGTNATVTATMAAVAAKTNYLAGYEITGLPATVLSSADITISGLQNTLTAEFAETTTSDSSLIVIFNPPRPASAVNTAVSVSVAALGASSAKVAVNVHGQNF